jgi:dTDP-4-amino-4,6-dideoxygalactose transaminase
MRHLEPSSLSFNGNKIITTSCGGAIVTKTKELKDRAIFFATQSEMMHLLSTRSEIGYTPI